MPILIQQQLYNTKEKVKLLNQIEGLLIKECHLKESKYTKTNLVLLFFVILVSVAGLMEQEN
jgi:hypothetical protein